MLEALKSEFRKSAPKADFCALRFVEETSEYLADAQPQPTGWARLLASFHRRRPPLVAKEKTL